ncbi:hypothetical protein, partial [Burkholderia sp. Tr-860]|uniref:hypothetical protein n=1 Tax=Burkholderia sp. Tr-860 TaxID=2608338 RepID=UPI001964BF0C
MKFTGSARITAVALLAAATLLSGCSSSDSDTGANDKKDTKGTSGSRPGPAETGPVVPAELGPEQVVQVLPGTDGLPGWERSGTPAADDLQRGSCKGKTDGWCKGALHTASTLFNRSGAGSIEFTVHAYDTAQSATAAQSALLADRSLLE